MESLGEIIQRDLAFSPPTITDNERRRGLRFLNEPALAFRVGHSDRGQKLDGTDTLQLVVAGR